MGWFAQAGTDVFAAPLLQYGLAGIVILALGIAHRDAIKRERAIADALRTENTRLSAILVEKAIPALEQSTSAVKDCMELLRIFHDPPAPRKRAP